MKRKALLTGSAVLLSLFMICAEAQTGKRSYFNIISPQNTADRNYGSVTVSAESHTVVIGTVMATGENVKSLNIQVNNGEPFKLAPAPGGSVLNYVGSALNIVLQPGDKAKIEFTVNPKVTSARNIYVSGERID